MSETNATKKISAIIAMAIVLTVVMTVLFIAVPIVYYAADDMEKEGLATTDNALNGLNILLKSYQNEARIYAVAVAANSDLKRHLKNNDVAEIEALLLPIFKESKLDAISVTNARGVVIFRAHAPAVLGDSIANQANVADAMEGKVSTTIERGAVTGLGLRAGAPVRDGQGQVIGVVSTSFTLNKNGIVDNIKDIYKTDSTLFVGDTRVATTIVGDGQRAIGTKLDPRIAKVVLEQGLRYSGRAAILGTEYITAYQPIFGPRGTPEGIMFAGQNLSVYLEARNRMLMTVGIATLLAIAMSIGIALKLGKRIAKPLIESVKALHASEEQVRLLINSTAEAIFGVDLQGNCTFANPSCLNLLGYAELKQLLGKNMQSLLQRPDADKQAAVSGDSQMFQVLVDGNGVHRVDEIIPKPDGTSFPAEYWSYPQFADGELTGAVVTFNDISERKRAEEKIMHMATHDDLTGLPTLSLAKERIALAVDTVYRNKTMIAVMFIDLDGFKAINDNNGHDAGDYVLRNVADILKNSVRETDTVARVAGDEFLLVAVGLHSVNDAAKVAKKIVGAVSRPFSLNGQKTQVTASVGIALFPDDAEDVDSLISKADTAMYVVKNSGKNGYGFAKI